MTAKQCPEGSFTCTNQLCRSTAILCSGVDGCGDNSDEERCEFAKSHKGILLELTMGSLNASKHEFLKFSRIKFSSAKLFDCD
ncbi:low-density lipoprotein receptor-like protein 7 [Sarcoptes scabiei]|uniref:Low-density lipoprotein receptor-like protein 7 n=1 Tax=Sarcoptes scabiei TaxID=52283 RepID=A0A132AJP4_SARSC|nr:low-density lipoprotein receptor-like protein 7 [Sarcoptes scabiei]